MSVVTAAVKGVKTVSVGISKFSAKPKITKALFSCPKEIKSDHFTVGFGRDKIMPKDVTAHRYYIAGYGSYNPAKGVIEPVYAHAVWIDDNSGLGGIVLVSVDCVGLLSYDVSRINDRLTDFKKETGCRSINLMATHTHAGIDTMGMWGSLPLTGRRKDYMDIVYNGIITAVKVAYAGRRDGDLYFGNADTENIQDDKREPSVFCKRLYRLRFVPQDGSKEIYMVNYASHPEVLYGSNSYVCPDYPAYMRKKITDKTGADVIFFNGAVGGMITPLVANPNNRRVSTKIAGEKIADVCLGITNEEKLKPSIGVIRQEFLAKFENTMLLLCGLFHIMPSDKVFSGDGPLGISIKTSLTYIEIGKAKLLTIPGELFPELAYGGYLENGAAGSPDMNPKPLTEIAGDPDMMIFGLGNDELGYILPPNDFLLNEKYPYILRPANDFRGCSHYEETESAGGCLGPTIAAEFTKMMETVNKTRN